MSPKKKQEKLPMKYRCVYFCFSLLFTAIGLFLGLVNLNNAESQGIPEIFIIAPFAIGSLAFLGGLCILLGIWTPSKRYVVVRYV